MDFLKDDDLVHSTGGQKIDWEGLYVQPLKTKGQSIRLRPVVSFNNDALYLKGVGIHRFLKGVGQSVCTNTKQNIEQGRPCPFCNYIKDKLNPIYSEMYSILKELGYELPSDPDLKKLQSALYDALKTKRSEKLAELKTQANKYEMSKTEFLNYLPVLDITNPSKVRLFEHKSSIKKAIKDFHDSGKDIKNFDITVIRKEEKGNYYSVGREDQSPITDSQKQVIDTTLPEIEKALDVMFGEKARSEEVVKEKFNKYIEKLEGVVTDQTQTQATVSPSQPAQATIPVTNDVVAPSSESFTVEPY